MNDLVLWGDVTVAYQINFEGPLNDLVKEVIDPKDNYAGLGIERATKILNKY